MNPETLIPKLGVVTKITKETPDVKTFQVVGPDGKKPSFKIIKAQTAISTAENSTENRRPKNSFLKFSIEKAP